MRRFACSTARLNCARDGGVMDDRLFGKCAWKCLRPGPATCFARSRVIPAPRTKISAEIEPTRIIALLHFTQRVQRPALDSKRERRKISWPDGAADFSSREAIYYLYKYTFLTNPAILKTNQIQGMESGIFDRIIRFLRRLIISKT